jgi:hypothetical protein
MQTQEAIAMGWKLDKELERWPGYRDEHLTRLAEAMRNPLGGDLTHSYVNAWKELCETFPYQMGHVLAWGAALTVFVLLPLIIWIHL